MEKNQFYGGHFCIFPVAYAYDGMDLCAYHCGGIPILCVLYPMDCLFSSLFHRCKHGERRIFRRCGTYPDRRGEKALLLQGVATSIDALSVGFTNEQMDLAAAFVCALIIAAVTFAVCVAGVMIGRKFGVRLADKAAVLGGIILISIGLKMVLL